MVEGDAKSKTSCDGDGEEKTNGSVFFRGWVGCVKVRRRKERVSVGAAEAGARSCQLAPQRSVLARSGLQRHPFTNAVYFMVK